MPILFKLLAAINDRQFKKMKLVTKKRAKRAENFT